MTLHSLEQQQSGAAHRSRHGRTRGRAASTSNAVSQDSSKLVNKSKTAGAGAQGRSAREAVREVRLTA